MWRNVIGFIVALLFCSCDKVFEYSPFQATVSKKMRNTTQKNLEKISGTDLGDTVVIALISDSHISYDDLYTAVAKINKDNSVDFTVFCGDMTDNGILKEFELFYDRMKKLEKPYFTVIGNHDCLANGHHIYSSMFGDGNYSFVSGNFKFVFFKNNVWENHNELPDFNWLETELDNGELFSQQIVFAHIPPFGDQMRGDLESVYVSVLRKHNVKLSVHGHIHEHMRGFYYDNTTEYIIVGSVNKGNLCKLILHGNSYTLENIGL